MGLKGLVDEGRGARAHRPRDEAASRRTSRALEKKLASPGFVDRAPPEVVEESKKQRASLVEAKARLEEARKLAEEL